MTNYAFFDLEGSILLGTIINTALLGGLVYLTVRVVKTVLKKTRIKTISKRR